MAGVSSIIDIKSHGPDRYGRTLGEVFLDGNNINLEMVKAGLAEVYRGTPAKGQNMEPYWKAEEEARKAGRGMWVLGDKYVTRGIGERRNPDYSECNGWEDTEETDA